MECTESFINFYYWNKFFKICRHIYQGGFSGYKRNRSYLSDHYLLSGDSPISWYLIHCPPCPSHNQESMLSTNCTYLWSSKVHCLSLDTKETWHFTLLLRAPVCCTECDLSVTGGRKTQQTLTGLSKIRHECKSSIKVCKETVTFSSQQCQSTPWEVPNWEGVLFEVFKSVVPNISSMTPLKLLKIWFWTEVLFSIKCRL